MSFSGLSARRARGTTAPPCPRTRARSSSRCPCSWPAPAPRPRPPKTDAKKVEAKKPEAKPEPKKVDAKKPDKADKPAEPAVKFRKGQMAKPGMSPADVLEWNKAQGDPMGSIDLKTALAGDPNLEDATKGKLFATFDTTMGEFKCELYEDKAPNTVANFVGLARGVRPYYIKKEDAWKTGPYFNGALFHRVIDKFMIQTGDPLGGPGGFGTGGPGYLIVDEFGEGFKHDGPGYLSMANRGVNTGSSQFFVTVAATPHLDGKHAIFGKCDPKVPTAISKVNTRADKPVEDVKINAITVTRAKK
jgi:peptidyl-prolyl cis-trans isomerase A (cyclophilin A)